MRYWLVLASLVFAVAPAAAQVGDNGVTSFKENPDSWKRGEAEKVEILQTIIDSMGRTAINNITESEQVFCYEVASKPIDYVGYTINNMAVTGFCGVINKELKAMIVKQFLANQKNLELGIAENCVIKPRLMFRFIRGVDYTDMLLSAPCHSYSLFYGGKVKTYNFKPGAEIIDTMVEAFKKHHAEFVSPALLNQLLPVGMVQTQEQKDLIEKQSGPVRGWADETAKTPETDTKTGGWNKLKF